MNLILFEPDELGRPLALTDRRAQHLLTVLRRQPGETFDVGVVNGRQGKGTIRTIDSNALELEFTWGAPPSPPDPITLVVGLPRPQTARDILRDASTLGLAALHFVRTEKGDANYVQSSLWTSGEWRRHLRAGAEQAFATQLPELSYNRTIAEILASLPAGGHRLALDNYEARVAISRVDLENPPVVLAIGSERGWSAADRHELRAAGFELVHLGTRVLRTETAVIAALAIVRAKLGLM